MSVRATTWAWNRKISSTEKLVLLELSDRVNDKRGDDACWPEQETIAQRTGFTSRTVNSALKALETKGLIKRQRRMINGRRTSDRITVLIKQLEVNSPAAQAPDPDPCPAEQPEVNSGSNRKEIPEDTGTTFRVIGKDKPTRLKQDNPAAFFPEFFEPNRPDLDAWNYAGRTIVEISAQLGTAIDWDSPGIQNLWPVVGWLKRLGDHKLTSCLIEVGARAVASNTTIRSWKYFEAEMSKAGD
ncbi:helix-turn-helix domain-containing protein [Bradyrhizobium diazoefficiens]|nr:helix-turn-helix domain-containing protein [Bradyrhizobium diazoefficiens]QQO22705.1 helix-turn-helix domain-containing protein [Bradyrhizobium diazoefficiens]